MFAEMFDALDAGREPMETFYDGYVVNAVVDACYRSAKTRQWEKVALDDWRGVPENDAQAIRTVEKTEGMAVIKREQMPDGRTKVSVVPVETQAKAETPAKAAAS
jgi:hypothetical protein